MSSIRGFHLISSERTSELYGDSPTGSTSEVNDSLFLSYGVDSGSGSSLSERLGPKSVDGSVCNSFFGSCCIQVSDFVSDLQYLRIALFDYYYSLLSH